MRLRAAGSVRPKSERPLSAITFKHQYTAVRETDAAALRIGCNFVPKSVKRVKRPSVQGFFLVGKVNAVNALE